MCSTINKWLRNYNAFKLITVVYRLHMSQICDNIKFMMHLRLKTWRYRKPKFWIKEIYTQIHTYVFL